MKFYFFIHYSMFDILYLFNKWYCNSGGDRTHDLLIKSQLLYQAELRGQNYFDNSFMARKAISPIPVSKARSSISKVEV